MLFLCVHNAGRSQMAAGWMCNLAGDRVDVLSGGSDPASQINPTAVEAMREVGIDIAGEFPRPWTDEIVGAADVVVTMRCGDACPVVPGKRYLDWELDDPPLGTTAHMQGRVAGSNAAGRDAVFAGSLGSQVVKLLDRVIARTGLRSDEARAHDVRQCAAGSSAERTASNCSGLIR